MRGFVRFRTALGTGGPAAAGPSRIARPVGPPTRHAAHEVTARLAARLTDRRGVFAGARLARKRGRTRAKRGSG